MKKLMLGILTSALVIPIQTLDAQEDQNIQGIAEILVHSHIEFKNMAPLEIGISTNDEANKILIEYWQKWFTEHPGLYKKIKLIDDAEYKSVKEKKDSYSDGKILIDIDSVIEKTREDNILRSKHFVVGVEGRAINLPTSELMNHVDYKEKKETYRNETPEKMASGLLGNIYRNSLDIFKISQLPHAQSSFSFPVAGQAHIGEVNKIIDKINETFSKDRLKFRMNTVSSEGITIIGEGFSDKSHFNQKVVELNQLKLDDGKELNFSQPVGEVKSGAPFVLIVKELAPQMIPTEVKDIKN